MFGGFRERAQATYELLKTPGTAFVVVAAPEPDALREASYFVDRLSAEAMPLAGMVLNRVRSSGGTAALGRTRRGRRGRAGRGRRARADRRGAARARRPGAAGGRRPTDAGAVHRAHPEVPIVEVPALSTDVHDLDGLRRIGTALAG